MICSYVPFIECTITYRGLNKNITYNILWVSYLKKKFQHKHINIIVEYENFFLNINKSLQLVILRSQYITDVIEFYRSDFIRDTLILHRDMYIDITKSKDISIQSLRLSQQRRLKTFLDQQRHR